MINKKIKDFSPGDEATLLLRLYDVQVRKTTAGNDYASMLGFDTTDIIEVKIWAFSEEIRNVLQVGEVYLASGRMKEYQGKMQFNVNGLSLANPDEFDLKDFYEYSKVDIKELKETIFSYIESLQDENIKKITSTIIKKYEDAYFSYPAAVNMHHNYYHGLAHHTYTMLLLSKTYLEIYPFLNRDLVISGIILHDLGKVIELSGPKGTEYTKEGKLLGHIVIGTNEIMTTATNLGLASSDAALALAHIVISHHDQADYGSPKEPIIPEAVVVHLLDLSDAKLAALEKEVLRTPAGEYTKPILIFDRRSFYIPNLKD